MSWLNPFSWFRDTVQPNVYNPDGNINENYFIPLNAEDYFFKMVDERAFLRAYNECGALKSIIKRRASAFGNGVIEVVKTTPSANYVRDPELLNLLTNPNPLQNQRQFFAQQNTYVDIFGYCPVLKVSPVGFPNIIKSIWNIPPWLFDIDYTSKWLKQTTVDGIYKSYKLFWNGESVTLDSKNTFFIFDDAIGTQDDTNLTIPDSRLTGLEYPICNWIGAYKSLHTLINKRGAIGILSNETKDSVGQIAMSPDEKKEVQDDFRRYGLTGQPWSVVITNANLKWQSMATNIKDLQLHEGLQEYTKEIARAYGYPSELLSLTDVPYLNRKYCKKELYSDAIIPDGNSRMEQFSSGIIPADQKIKIQYNFESIDVLQEEKLLQYQAEQQINVVCQTQFNNGLITKNDWLMKLGLDTVPDPEFDVYKEVVMTISQTERLSV